MNVQLMHYAIDQGLQKVGSNAYDTFLPEELDFFLNKMQERFIKDRFFAQSDSKHMGFQKTLKRLEDLQTLISEYSTTSLTSTTSTAVTFNLPSSGYLYLIALQVKLKKDSTSTSMFVPARIVEYDKVYEMLKNPFMTTFNTSPLAVIGDDKIKVFRDEKFILEGVELNYIKKPQEISLSLSKDCELAEHTHQEIVDLTIKHILEVIVSPRYQSNSLEESQSD